MADGTSVNSAQRTAPPPPPPPPPPKPDPVQQVQARSEVLAGEAAVNERRGAAGQSLLGTKPKTAADPPMPGAAVDVKPPPTRPIEQTRAAQEQQQQQQDKPKDSRFSRFMGGLWNGVKSGVTGIYEGGKALVTDPVGTAKALGRAVKSGAEATVDYGKRLVNDPGKTLKETGDWVKQKANDIANAKAEDWGKFIGENAVGMVGAYGAGKVLQGAKLLRHVPKAPEPKALPKPPGHAPDVKAPPKVDAPKVDAPKLDAQKLDAQKLDANKTLTNPKQTEPFGNQKITEKGIHGQGGLTRAEGEAINKFRDKLNAHNERFGLNRDLPPTAGTGRDAVAQTNRAGDKTANLHAEIRRTDEAVNKHLKPDDIAGRLKEKRGANTGYDHVKETDGAYRNLKQSVERIDKYLADNPQLPESQARYLLDRRNGHAELARTLETQLGFR